MADPLAYEWKHPARTPRPFDEVIIYEMHVGSFTPEGTLAAAEARLAHVAALGFTAGTCACLYFLRCEETLLPSSCPPKGLPSD